MAELAEGHTIHHRLQEDQDRTFRLVDLVVVEVYFEALGPVYDREGYRVKDNACFDVIVRLGKCLF
jgi:hypothetical protein